MHPFTKSFHLARAARDGLKIHLHSDGKILVSVQLFIFYAWLCILLNCLLWSLVILPWHNQVYKGLCSSCSLVFGFTHFGTTNGGY